MTDIDISSRYETSNMSSHDRMLCNEKVSSI